MGEIGVTGEIYFQIMSLDPADDVKKSIEETIGTGRGKYSGIEEECLMQE